MELLIENLSKAYQENQVLHALTVTLKGGDVVGLLGRNGAGKTTFINCLIDLVEPSSGQFFLDGQVLSGDRLAFKRMLGISSDVVPPVPEFTGADYLRFVSLVHRLDSATAQKRSTELTNFFFDDTRVLSQKIGQYSTGMIKKIGLCAAVLNLPSILILDEPFAGLDPVAVQQLINFLKAYRRPDRLILIASHDLNHVEEVANRILVLDETTLKFDGDLAQFTAQGTKAISEALFDLLTPQSKVMTFDWL